MPEFGIFESGAIWWGATPLDNDIRLERSDRDFHFQIDTMGSREETAK